MKTNGPYLDSRYRITRWWQKPFWRKVHELVAVDWLGNDSAPCSDLNIHKWDIHDNNYRICTFVDDGNEIGLGYGDEWRMIMRRKEFNKIVISYIRIWIFHEWLGIRTWIYWKSLRKMCEKRNNPQ